MNAQSTALFAPPRVVRRDLGDGAFVLASGHTLGACPDHLCLYLDHWADVAPDRVFLAERAGDGWRTLDYCSAREHARAVAAALLNRGLTADDPVMVLSDNSIDSALLQLGALIAGIPFAPVSPAYSLLSRDFAKLTTIHALLRPGLIFAQDGAALEPALNVMGSQAEIVVSRNPPSNRSVTLFEQLVRPVPMDGTTGAYPELTPDTIAKILFTSGSTGTPKGVINTHRMLCSNQEAIAVMWPFLERHPPVIVDWLPWNHTFGGNHNFNLILRNGGTLYIDGGKPAPGSVETTIANLKEISPTLYFNVPRGFDMILPALEADTVFRDHFFSKLDIIFYAAAALPQSTWERLEALSLASRDEKVPMTSAWGATETAPLATCAHFRLERAGVIGVPAPGVEIKMIPDGNKLEMRVRGANVTPGYYRRDDLTDAAFDEEGFYKIGDAGRLADPEDPAKGILFDGRVAEDFKLLTGVWVNTGAVRIAALAACAPVIQDAVVTGHDRDEVGLLVFPSPAGCAALTGGAVSDPLGSLIASPEVRQKLSEGLAAMNAEAAGSKARIGRVFIMSEPPQIDANEITDKGYINQRAVLERRADLIKRLYRAKSAPAGTDDPDVVLIG